MLGGWKNPARRGTRSRGSDAPNGWVHAQHRSIHTTTASVCAVPGSRVIVAKTAELLKRLRRAGCSLVRHGKKHDIWKNPLNGQQTSVPRHSGEIPNGTYNGILRQLGIE